jgi:hypothetical protein
MAVFAGDGCVHALSAYAPAALRERTKARRIAFIAADCTF